MNGVEFALVLRIAIGIWGLQSKEWSGIWFRIVHCDWRLAFAVHKIFVLPLISSHSSAIILRINTLNCLFVIEANTNEPSSLHRGALADLYSSE